MSFAAITAAISLGDYPAYLNIEAYLKSFVGSGRNSYTSAVAELALASVAVSVCAPNMVPAWLPAGDFSAFPPKADLGYIHYLRAKYFLCLGKYEVALAVAQTALAFSALEWGISAAKINLQMVCALACYNLGREREARRWLLEVMGIALPHGFITPFAENVSNFGGLMEQCLEEKFPGCFDAVLGQCERTVRNWLVFHNHFIKDNITSILTLRELHLAQMVARRIPYAKIAREFNMSVGRLKNVMLEIYEKLCISSRDELAQYVLMTNKGAES